LENRGRVGQNEYIDESLRSFLLKLGGRAPEPAGGAALALAGASAAALLSLACHSEARGRSGVSAENDLLLTTQRRAEQLSDEIQTLIDADVAAYREVTQALRLPRDTDEQRRSREERLDTALGYAAEVPLRLAEAALEILDSAAGVADLVRGPVLGDLAAAVHLAEATVKGSLRNAHLNCSAISDRQRARDAEERISRVRERFERSAIALSSALVKRGLPG
jgi:formiminotetrahydrofolate cyclodeaminase